MKQINPRGLTGGATLGVIAPAGPADPERVAQVPALLQKHGFRAKLFPGCHAQHPTLPYLAGDDALRLQDLHAAFADPEVAAVLCLRGGYGCLRLLDRIDTALLRRHPKLLIGYSDITALHLLLNGLGLPSLQAPMPASDLLHEDAGPDAESLFACLREGLPAGLRLAPPLEAGLRQGGRVTGELSGGNLAVLCSLLGTPFAPRLQGRILFLEDIGEAPYRVDRMLAQLRLAGVLDAAAGFLLGSFTEADSPQAVLADYLLPLGKSVLGGWPSGHGRPHQVLPLGVRVALDAGEGSLTLLQDFPTPGPT
nr:LD-carboxypeptidase [uncultured Roseateles sp.]